MKKHIRIEKLNRLIQKHLTIIINFKINELKNNIITITKVITLWNLSKSKILISTFRNKTNVIELLNNSSKLIRFYLSNDIKTYKVPHLLFIDNAFFNNISKIKISALIKKNENLFD